MKVGILAGGLGSTPLGRDRGDAEADGRDRRQADPLAHHAAILRTTDTTSSSIALGYKGEVIKRYMVEYSSLATDLTVRSGRRLGRARTTEPRDDWTVELIDTGF